MKFFQFAALALLAAAAGFSAAAEGTTPECPADADVQAWQASARLEWVTTNEDLSRDGNQTVALVSACPDRPFVQYFGALSYFYVARKLSDPVQQFQFISAATNALKTYDATAPADGRAWQPGLKNKDGSDVSVDTVSGASTLLAMELVPAIVTYEARGQFHEFVSSEGHKPGNPCPWQTPDLAVAEAAGYSEGYDRIDQFYYANGQLPNIAGSVRRIEFLKTACPAGVMGLSSRLGKLYAAAARGADSIGDTESASSYAKLAITEYEAYRPLAVANGAAPSMIAATDRVLKEMHDLTGDDAPAPGGDND